MAPDEPVDYVVVGSGSSGAVVAHRLSADPDRTVLLLEAGGPDDQPEIHGTSAGDALALLTSEWSPRIDWGYATEPQKGLDGRVVPIARGKVLGGSSSVNALMWVRGNPADYDGWNAPGWAFDEVLPYFTRAEAYTGAGADSPLRGGGGPVRVRALDRPSAVARAFVAAAAELGYGTGDDFDYNGAEQRGSGFYYQTTRTPENTRSSTATAYLDPVRDRPNLRIETGAHATRLVVDDGRVVAVEYLRNGETRTAPVRREAVLSAGAFESPKLLMLSGIGPAAHLREHGIPVVRDLPGVGRNLQDHVFVPLCHQSAQEHAEGALISEAGLFPSEELQFTFGPIKFLPPTAPASAWEGPGYTFAPIVLLPRSRGEVLLRGSDPLDNAVVDPHYLDDDTDLDLLVDGLKLARELAATRAFDGVRGEELAPGADVRDDAALREYARANATTLWHPVGTCRMGADEDAVVDERLRVHGVDGLRVADASIMPKIVSGNTHAACVMIGEKAADLIIASDRGPTPGGRP
jgi:choline dehydrogenase-like flavoprotein